MDLWLRISLNLSVQPASLLQLQGQEVLEGEEDHLGHEGIVQAVMGKVRAKGDGEAGAVEDARVETMKNTETNKAKSL
jgi:hypothetical protein